MGLKPSCMKSDETKLTISSSCFDKKISISLNNDDEGDMEILSTIVNNVMERKKTIIEKKRQSLKPLEV